MGDRTLVDAVKDYIHEHVFRSVNTDGVVNKVSPPPKPTYTATDVPLGTGLADKAKQALVKHKSQLDKAIEDAGG